MTRPTETSLFSTVTTLAARRTVHQAFGWFHAHAQELIRWQMDLVVIPAPPFGEAERSAWAIERFMEAGLSEVRMDSVGNVFGIFPSTDHSAYPTTDFAGPVVVLSAHLDTVFPADVPLQPVLKDDRIEAPGIMDNAAGVIGMLAVAHAVVQAGVSVSVPIVFMANVGEEGEGDLRGVRHLYLHNALAGRIAAHIALDGAGTEAAVSTALGSQRYRITVRGPGGHSFTDAGTPNPIAALAAAVASFAEEHLPAEPRTTLNIGTMHGGTSVNSIPQSATATVDMRSTSAEQLLLLEVALYRAVEDAVEGRNRVCRSLIRSGTAVRSGTACTLTFEIEKIGDRPAAELAADSALLLALRAVDRHLGLRTDLRLGSTDANLPLSMGVPAIALGAGGDGGGAHTEKEWYCAKDRESGLRRILLLILTMAEWAAAQSDE